MMDVCNQQVDVDLLYFRAREGGFHYGIRDERVLQPAADDRLGFRVRYLKGLPHDGWVFSVAFLHYHARETREKSGPVLPSWGHPGRMGDAAAVRSRWRLHMGFLDASLAKAWHVSPCVTAGPFWGLRYAGVRHKTRVNYRGETEDELSMKNKFWGIGPQMGASLCWRIREWVFVFWSGSLNLLLGEFYVHSDEESPGASDLGKIHFLEKFGATAPIKDMAAGVGFVKAWECLSLHVRLGWEAHLLPGQNHLPRYTSRGMPGQFVAAGGDLMVSGWLVGGSVEF